MTTIDTLPEELDLESCHNHRELDDHNRHHAEETNMVDIGHQLDRIVMNLTFQDNRKHPEQYDDHQQPDYDDDENDIGEEQEPEVRQQRHDQHQQHQQQQQQQHHRQQQQQQQEEDKEQKRGNFQGLEPEQEQAQEQQNNNKPQREEQKRNQQQHPEQSPRQSQKRYRLDQQQQQQLQQQQQQQYPQQQIPVLRHCKNDEPPQALENLDKPASSLTTIHETDEKVREEMNERQLREEMNERQHQQLYPTYQQHNTATSANENIPNMDNNENDCDDDYNDYDGSQEDVDEIVAIVMDQYNATSDSNAVTDDITKNHNNDQRSENSNDHLRKRIMDECMKSNSSNNNNHSTISDNVNSNDDKELHTKRKLYRNFDCGSFDNDDDRRYEEHVTMTGSLIKQPSNQMIRKTTGLSPGAVRVRPNGHRNSNRSSSSSTRSSTRRTSRRSSTESFRSRASGNSFIGSEFYWFFHPRHSNDRIVGLSRRLQPLEATLVEEPNSTEFDSSLATIDFRKGQSNNSLGFSSLPEINPNGPPPIIMEAAQVELITEDEPSVDSMFNSHRPKPQRTKSRQTIQITKKDRCGWYCTYRNYQYNIIMWIILIVLIVIVVTTVWRYGGTKVSRPSSTMNDTATTPNISPNNTNNATVDQSFSETEYNGDDYVYNYPYTLQHALVIVLEAVQESCTKNDNTTTINIDESVQQKIMYTIQCNDGDSKSDPLPATMVYNDTSYDDNNNNNTNSDHSPVAIGFETSTQNGYCVRTHVNQLNCSATIQPRGNRTELVTIFTCGMIRETSSSHHTATLVSVHIQQIILPWFAICSESSSIKTSSSSPTSTTPSTINDTITSSVSSTNDMPKLMISLNRICHGQLHSVLQPSNHSCYYDDNDDFRNVPSHIMEWSNHHLANDTYTPSDDTNTSDWSFCYINGATTCQQNIYDTTNTSNIFSHHDDCKENNQRMIMIPDVTILDDLTANTTTTTNSCPFTHGYQVPDIFEYLVTINDIIEQMV